MMKFILNPLRSSAGTSAIEYALVASLISVAAAGVLLSMGTSVTNLFTRIGNAF